MDALLLTILELLNKGGVIMILIMIAFGGWKEIYIWKNTHEKILGLEKERSKELLIEKDKQIAALERAIVATEKQQGFWQDQTLTLLRINQKALGATNRVVDVVENITSTTQG